MDAIYAMRVVIQNAVAECAVVNIAQKVYALNTGCNKREERFWTNKRFQKKLVADEATHTLAQH